MTRTTSGNSGGNTFRIDNALGDIALTRRGIIVATSEGRVYDWLCDCIRSYEDNRYSVRYAETEDDFDILSGKQRMVMAFIEDCFFGNKTLGKLNRIHKQHPKLRVTVFSVSTVSPGMIIRYVSWSQGSYLSLRSGGKEIREALEAVFSGERSIPPSLWESVDEYSRLPDFEPYLTRREIEIVRCIADGRTVREAAETLTVSEHTVTNHLGNVYRKFGTRNRVEVLKLAVSKGVLPVNELMSYTVQS
ncbi:MAG: response regulator transcription factor [Prevotellaceae bacterium]|jgi:DNA-binding NarL/FixJ family response regulator|nr:response regulator transcription factor [Prevotellaceae bacterium]